MSDQDPAPVETTTSAPAANTAPATQADPAATNGNKGYWPDDWRDKVAGDDEKARKGVEHFGSPADIYKSFREMRAKMDSGEYKRNVAFNPEWSDEEKSQWRKENGVPEAPDGYKLPEGLIVSEEDKPVVDQFLADMHVANLPADKAGDILNWYYKTQSEQQAAAIEQDRIFQSQTEEALRAEYGPEYLANKNMASEFAVNQFGPEIGKALMEAGPGAFKALVKLAREINPAMTVVPNSGTPNQAISDELAALKSKIGTPEWFRDKDAQARYQQLVDAQSKMQKRG